MKLEKDLRETYIYRAYRTGLRSPYSVRRPQIKIWHSVKDAKRTWKRLHSLLLELFYAPHIAVRYLHDHLYHKSRGYKKYHDRPSTETVHRAALAGFLASFLIFNVLQYSLPSFFDLFKPKAAYADTNSVSWDTKGEFSTGQTPNVDNNGQVVVSGT